MITMLHMLTQAMVQHLEVVMIFIFQTPVALIKAILTWVIAIVYLQVIHMDHPVLRLSLLAHISSIALNMRSTKLISTERSQMLHTQRFFQIRFLRSLLQMTNI
jgi:hypothetical protein